LYGWFSDDLYTHPHVGRPASGRYYGYLVLYKLGSHKRLKLLCGLMMLNLSLVLLVMPELLNNGLMVVGLFAIAILTAGLMMLVDSRRPPRQVGTDVKLRERAGTRDSHADG
jgi:hypothetical protein